MKSKKSGHSSVRISYPRRVKHPSPGSPCTRGAPWVSVPQIVRTLKGFHSHVLPLQGKFSFQDRNPGCATSTWRPWALVYIPFGEKTWLRCLLALTFQAPFKDVDRGGFRR